MNEDSLTLCRNVIKLCILTQTIYWTNEKYTKCLIIVPHIIIRPTHPIILQAQQSLLMYIFGQCTQYCERRNPINVPHYSGGMGIGHSYGEPSVRGIKSPFKCRESVRSRQFIWRIYHLFMNRSSIRDGVIRSIPNMVLPDY